MDALPADNTIDPFELLAKRLQTSVLDEEIELLPETLRAPWSIIILQAKQLLKSQTR